MTPNSAVSAKPTSGALGTIIMLAVGAVFAAGSIFGLVAMTRATGMAQYKYAAIVVGEIICLSLVVNTFCSTPPK